MKSWAWKATKSEHRTVYGTSREGMFGSGHHGICVTYVCHSSSTFDQLTNCFFGLMLVRRSDQAVLDIAKYRSSE